MEKTADKIENPTLLPHPIAVVPNALREESALFIGPVSDGFFQASQDKLESPPRWEQGNYSLTAGKWPSPIPNLIDLTPYNGYVLVVIAADWDKEVISQARIVGVMTAMAGDVLTKFAYSTLQEKEEEIDAYTSGISN
ncbi:hypothetical protein MKJ04_21530 [Pontibacter sp. E15-1]|uniref:hypothetical protein n=1 Tax=Pontibacter sp. E15-1 TaxID=2919918 RepID=UPI001F4F9E30|nr:hypothetical protein [Pontibacter sp. E15-1]MCJ8167437.1 hypothetical protein [Pontibacter sp. E15-1]